MPNPLVECIANYSDARRPEVIEQIAAVIEGVNGTNVINVQSDEDHNRSVITFVGSPEGVEEAAFLSIKKAAELINLDEHTGEHPRLGATDVVPFVPIRDITMQDCIEMARRLGKRVADELSIPVYLYEEAAASPERVNLENIRKGQYEAIKEEIGTVESRRPDFGPLKLGTAGAVVIGARQPLIAYNVYLTTDDVSIAKKIGQAVRHSSGGYRFVKGMGFLVEGRAQVSMNLTNFNKSPVARVQEAIRREAQRYGVGIHHSELVGMIPQKALNDAAIWYLQLDQFETNQILEERLNELNAGKTSEEPKEYSFQEALASAEPTPGGGSAAAHTGANAAALVSMVARLTTSKKKYADVHQEMWLVLEQSEKLRSELNAAVHEDAEAFDTFMQAMKMPRGTDEQQAARNKAMDAATFVAADVPLKVAKMSVEVMKLALVTAEKGNVNAISDAASAFAFAKAAMTSAGMNVRINLAGKETDVKAKPYFEVLRSLQASCEEMETKLNEQLSGRGGLDLS